MNRHFIGIHNHDLMIKIYKRVYKYLDYHYRCICPKCGSSRTERDWALDYSICMSCNHSFITNDAERWND